MAFIHHHEGVILLGEIADLVHRSDVAVHGEHTVGAYDAEPLGLSLLETALKIGHIRVGISVTNCLAKPYAIDDGCVIKRIGDDGVLCGEQWLEHSAVCIEAGGVKYGVFCLEEP